jgi:hypothetical protein
MISPVIKHVARGVFLTALLLTLPVPTQVFAKTGMGARAGSTGCGGMGGIGGIGGGHGGGGVGFGGGYFYSSGPGGPGALAGPGPGPGWGFYSTQQPGSSYARSLGTKATKKHRKAM